MQHRLRIQIDAPAIEEYHDVLYHIQQQLDAGFTDGSHKDSTFYSDNKITFEWSIGLVPEEGHYYPDGTSIYDDPLS